MAATSPGFDTCRSSRSPWRASVQERFCKAANVVVVIVERRQEFLVRGQVPFGAPLQVASKQVQSVAMFNFLRHVSQVDPFVAD
jgi:hypothetical protein